MITLFLQVRSPSTSILTDNNGMVLAMCRNSGHVGVFTHIDIWDIKVTEEVDIHSLEFYNRRDLLSIFVVELWMRWPRSYLTFTIVENSEHLVRKWQLKEARLQWNIYRPQTKLREGNVLHLPVSHSVHKGGLYPCMQWAEGCVSQHAMRGGCLPLGLWVQGVKSPLGRHPPRRPLNRAVCILLECNLVIY